MNAAPAPTPASAPAPTPASASTPTPVAPAAAAAAAEARLAHLFRAARRAGRIHPLQHLLQRHRADAGLPTKDDL